jgi:hypothetical protein
MPRWPGKPDSERTETGAIRVALRYELAVPLQVAGIPVSSQKSVLATKTQPVASIQFHRLSVM